MVYIYFCPSCGSEIEVQHDYDKCPIIICDKCYTLLKKKITGGVGFILKGPGFYSTDKKTK